MCVDKSDECTDDIKDIVSNISGLADEIAKQASAGGKIDVLAIIKDMGGSALALSYGLCANPSNIFTAWVKILKNINFRKFTYIINTTII